MHGLQIEDLLLLKASLFKATLQFYEAALSARSVLARASGVKTAIGFTSAHISRKNENFSLRHLLSIGNSLFVGEGNLSFSACVCRMQNINPRDICTTTFEDETDLSVEARYNARLLSALGARVLHGIDGADLRSVFRTERFSNIVFMFPNVASREPSYGRNPNHPLVCRFLASAARHLNPDGKVVIAAVDNGYYRGAFNFIEAARKSGYAPPTEHPFHPEDFPGYEHVMTHQEGSALEVHDKFSVWIFQLN